MPFTPINVVNGSTPANATWGNLVQTQYTEATSSLGQDLTQASPFVLSGLACVKDPVTANKLNVGAGVAYLLQTDSTLRRRANSLTSVTTSALSSTYFLDLNPDGTFSFATTHSGVANYLPICSVTTDGSGNISGVTDARVFTLKLLTGGVTSSVKTPPLQLPAPISAILTQSASNAAAVNGGVTFGQTGALAASMDGAALFNGTTGYINVPTSGFPTSANPPFSLEVWIRLSAYAAATTVPIAVGANTGGQTLFIAVSSTGTVALGNNTTATAFSTALALNVWHHLVGTYDGTNLRMYVDGALTGGPTAGSVTFNLGGAAPVTIGAESGSSAMLFVAGMLDEAAFYTTALSAARVTAHYNAGTATASDAYATTVLADSPLRYYRLGDAGGSAVAVCTTSPTATTVVDAGGTLKAIGGQASVGTLGAPVIVAQALNTHVTTTGDVTLLTYSVPADGLYEINGVAYFGNSSAEAIIFRAVWTDPNAAGASTTYFAYVGSSGTPSTPLSLSGAQAMSATQTIPTLPITVYAHSGTNIIVHWNDPAGVPNDFISVLIKRLS